MKPYKIVGLGGSLRPQSLSYRTLELALRKASNHNISTELIDLRKLHLPFCSGESLYSDYPDVEVLRKTIQSANGVLLSTPEYHGTMSGVLKNALDLLEEQHIAGKVVGLIAAVGGVHSTNALNAMRLVCRQLQCWVLPEQLVIPYSEESFNVQGELKDQELEKRLEKLIEYFVSAVRKLG